ncbi:MAG: hypothetical protein P1P89_12725 [Desulfobacterales bacterium]|nr:hypothetical protein [Desulfobacterales bacterium]
MALIQGFTSASCWSPFYVGMIVVLFAIPTLKWSDVAPSGAMLALTLIMTGWLYDRYAVRQSTLPAENPAKPELSALKFSQAIHILILLVASVMTIFELTGVAIPVTLGLVSPPFAIIWFVLIEFQPRTTIRRGVELTGKVVGGLPSLRNAIENGRRKGWKAMKKLGAGLFVPDISSASQDIIYIENLGYI